MYIEMNATVFSNPFTGPETDETNELNHKPKFHAITHKESNTNNLLLEDWLGRLDSNQGMAVPKTAALPLGYAPTNLTEAIGCAAL